MSRSQRKGRIGRLVGAFLVAGLLVAGPAAGPAGAAELTSYAGQGSGFALRVIVDLSVLPEDVKDEIQDNYETFRGTVPSAARALLPTDFPFKIDQRFIETLAQIGASTKAQALLGGTFEDAAEATKVGDEVTENLTKQQLPSSTLPIVAVSAGDLNAAVRKGPVALADGGLASVTVALDFLDNAGVGILPPELVAALQDLLANVNTQINTLTGATGELNDVLEDVAGTLDELCTEVDDTASGTGLTGLLEDTLGVDTNPCEEASVEEVVTSVTELPGTIQLPDLSNPLATEVARIEGIENEATSTKSTSKSAADAQSRIADIDVLDLVHVGAIDLRSHSEAAGEDGTAKNTSSCTLADVRIGSEGTGISLDGKTLYVGGTRVPVPTAEVNELKGVVDDVLEAAFLDVDLCDAAVEQAAADGTSASQTVSAFRVEFAPETPVAVAALGLDAGDPLFRVVIDPSVETSVSAEVGQGTTTTTNQSPSNPSSGDTSELPLTGAGTMATVIFGAALTAGALILRRRIA